MTRLPEPDGYMPYPMCHIKRYTEAQMLQFRRDALEEAAIEVKTEADYSGSNRQAVLMWAVNIIRKLKETT